MKETEDNIGSAHPPEFRPFWQALAAGQISFPKCAHCGRINWYPMERCTECLSDEFVPQTVSGPGRLHSWTIVRRAFSASHADKIPYVVGLVEFDEIPGTRLITNIIDCDFEDLAVDMPVEPFFSRKDDLPMVRFRPAQPKQKAST